MDRQAWPPHNPYTAFLVAVNVFLKKARVLPIHSKSSSDTAAALKRILDTTPMDLRPDLIIADRGTKMEG